MNVAVLVKFDQMNLFRVGGTLLFVVLVLGVSVLNFVTTLPNQVN